MATRTRTAKLTSPTPPKRATTPLKWKKPPKPKPAKPAPTYGRDDLSDEGGDVQRLVLSIVDNTARLAGGYLGWNLIVVRLPAGYTAAVNHVVSVALQGNAYVVTAQIGIHDGTPTFAGVPFDSNQIDPSVGQLQPIVLGLDSYPPAIARTQFADGSTRTVSDRIRYGTLGTSTVRTALHYGRSCTSDYRRAQRLWVLPTPGARPLALGLIAEPYPRADGAWPAAIATGMITPVYQGPSRVMDFKLPESWITALGDGSACGLTFAPLDATLGVSELELGLGGSGSLTDQYLDLSGS